MRRRITALVAATTSVVLLAFLVPSAFLVARVARANGEARAQTALQALVPLVAAGDGEGTRIAVDRLAGQGFPAWVVGPDGGVVGSDPSGGRLAAGQTSARTVDVDEGVLLVQPVSRDGATSRVFVLAPTARLREGVVRIWLVLGGLGVVLFVAALLVADRLARSIARPVTDLAATAARLETGDLAARVDPAGPREVHDVGVAINRLARRIGELLAAERESVADLSHRLRTPVTALRLEAGSVADDDTRGRLRDAVDDLDRAVDAIIREARRPVAADLGDEPRCDVAAVVRTRLAFWDVLAREEGRAVAARVPETPLPARVGDSDLAAALDALLGNVFAHTPRGTAFAVTVRPLAGGRVEVVVSDDGPGLPSAGVVARGASGGGSTGLGLSIVRRTAEGVGGAVRLGRGPAGGLEVTVTFEPA